MRRLPALALATCLLASACTAAAGSSSGTPEPTGASGSGSLVPSQAPQDVSAKALARQACANESPEILLRTWRGIMPGRSGDIQIVPKYPNFVNGGLTHATPFAYTQDVPLFLYGPGYVKPGVYDKALTLADLAPTTGQLVKFDLHAPDGQAQTQALLPADQRPLPRLVVTLVVAQLLGAVAAYYYTQILFGGMGLCAFVQMNLAAGMYLLVVLSLSFLASALMRSTVGAGALSFGLWVLVLVASSLPRIGRYTPPALLTWAAQLGVGQPASGYWPALWVSVALIALCLVAAWLHFRREEL